MNKIGVALISGAMALPAHHVTHTDSLMAHDRAPESRPLTVGINGGVVVSEKTRHDPSLPQPLSASQCRVKVQAEVLDFLVASFRDTCDPATPQQAALPAGAVRYSIGG